MGGSTGLNPASPGSVGRDNVRIGSGLSRGEEGGDSDANTVIDDRSNAGSVSEVESSVSRNRHNRTPSAHVPATPDKLGTAPMNPVPDAGRRPRFMSQQSESSSQSSVKSREMKLSTPRVLPRGDLGSASRSFASRLAHTPSSASASPSSSRSKHESARSNTVVPAPVPAEDAAQAVDSEEFGGARQGTNNADVGDSVVFGTNINLQDSMAIFRSFFREFTKTAGDDPYYIGLLHEIHETEVYCVNIDCKNIHSFGPPGRKFYQQLLHYPAEIIPIMDLVVHEEYAKLFGDDFLSQTLRRIQVRTFNLDKVKRMRDLDPSDIDQLVALHGMIIRSSNVIPDLKAAFFRCAICSFEEEVVLDRGIIAEPTSCDNCGKRMTMQLVHNRSIFADKQYIKLQESPENIPEGETPHTVALFAYDELVDVAKPGDRVEVTGILKSKAMRVNPRQRSIRSIHKTYVDVLHFKKTRKGQLSGSSGSAENGTITDESRFQTFAEDEDDEQTRAGANEAVYREMAQDPDLYEKLANSVAPSIWKLDDVKKGVLCLLFGGTNKETAATAESRSTHKMRARGELNILLCGDPGTSKSQLLGYVHKLAPRGIYTSGKGSSAVGLTAYISKDPETKELILESGALVLSDRGVCCIDEFDKMSDTTRAILHECMEQQTISIAKAGIIATLNARTSILASANPIESKYNPRLSVVQNIQLPPTLLSRFDLIYLILDKPDANTDRRLAKHLVQLYFRERENVHAVYPSKTVSDYIAYAKKTCHPILTSSAVKRLVDGYVEMRQLGALGGGKKTITATPRQLESLVRIAEARARIRLSPEVQESDVAEALRLMHVATQRAALDPRTGTIDMDAINTGMGTADRQVNEALATELFKLLEANHRTAGARVFQLVKEVSEQSSVPVSNEAVMKAINLLKDDGRVSFSAQTGTVSIV